MSSGERRRNLNLTYRPKPIQVHVEILGIDFLGRHPLSLDEFNTTRRGVVVSLRHPEVVNFHHARGKHRNPGEPDRASTFTPEEQAENSVLYDDVAYYVQHVLGIPDVRSGKRGQQSEAYAGAVNELLFGIIGVGQTDERERERVRQDALNNLYASPEMQERTATYGERLQSRLRELTSDDYFSGGKPLFIVEDDE
jgi:hypothetical protein